MNMPYPVISIFLAVMVMLTSSQLRADDEWSYEWDALIPPNSQDSFWMKRGDGEAKVREDGFLISTSEEQSLIFFVTEEGSRGVWDGSVPLVIEFSAQTLPSNSKLESGAHLSVSNGSRCAAVKIRGEPDEHYRLEWRDGEASLWVNGVEANELIQILTLKPEDTMTNCLYFGDESIAVGGDSLWHYIKWKPLQP